MADRTRIDIDCDSGTVSIDGERFNSMTIGVITESRSFLIADVFAVILPKLMRQSIAELKELQDQLKDAERKAKRS